MFGSLKKLLSFTARLSGRRCVSDSEYRGAVTEVIMSESVTGHMFRSYVICTVNTFQQLYSKDVIKDSRKTSDFRQVLFGGANLACNHKFWKTTKKT